MHKDTTYINREYTNEYIIKEADKQKRKPTNGKHKKTKPLNCSQKYVKHKKLKG